MTPTTITNLPVETQLNILRHVPAEYLSQCELVCWGWHSLVTTFPFHMHRTRCHLQAQCGEQGLLLSVQKSGSSKSTVLTPDLWHLLKRAEVSELTLIGDDNDQHNDKAVLALLQLLEQSRQSSFRIVNVRALHLQNAVLAQRLLTLLSTEFVQEMNLRSAISRELSVAHIARMPLLCQMRLANSGETSLHTGDALVAKFEADMRHKPRLNVPFVAELECVSPETIASFINEWVDLPEAPFFEIKFGSCTAGWTARFGEICEQLGLRHVFYEFSNRASAHSHIKMKVREELSECSLFAVRDVPARSPVNQYVCFARYFRDF